jgi:hypothetical protein
MLIQADDWGVGWPERADQPTEQDAAEGAGDHVARLSTR